MGAGASSTFKQGDDSISEAELTDALAQLTTAERAAIRSALTATSNKELTTTEEAKPPVEEPVGLSQVASGPVNVAVRVVHHGHAATDLPAEWEPRVANLQQRFPQKSLNEIESALKVRHGDAHTTSYVL